MQEFHDKHMRRAIALARKGLGDTYPNPPVGAVVVKDGVIIGSGYHAKAGSPHAEVNALLSCEGKTHGADLYVTLEPCSTEGRTGPCTDAIVAHGIKRVFVGAMDPSDENGSYARGHLEKKGIEITFGICREECEDLIAPFHMRVTHRRPWITLKTAVSLDGRIACHNGHSRWITGEESRRSVHEIRETVDAILVGENTFLKDDPRLTARSLDKTLKVPLRIVLFTGEKIPETKNLVTDHPEKTLFVTSKSILTDELKRRGVQEWVTPFSYISDGEAFFDAFMKELYLRDICHLLVEGGSETYKSFMDHDLVDEICMYIAPKIIGSGPFWLSSMSHNISTVEESLKLKKVSWTKLGDDFFMQGKLFKGDRACSRD
ncbi:riboflavin biosynthesis protein RibD [PVC group bacterium (ex Bugula neritina AB1)]|nr:riboflavin biosynthesis protein RibD [PVC group bacterium (ex Bugula neritina AB1)]